MTKNGYTPKSRFFSEFEMKRFKILENGTIGNHNPYLGKKLVIGGFVFIRVLIIEIIFNRRYTIDNFTNNNKLVKKKSEYSWISFVSFLQYYYQRRDSFNQ